MTQRFAPTGKRAERTCVITSHGTASYLHSYDAGRLELGDDPTCWTSDATKALRMTPADAVGLLPAVRQWHDAQIGG